MAILRIIGQLAESGFQDKIKSWGLKYVSVQLTLSTYKLVSALTWKWFPKRWGKNVAGLDFACVDVPGTGTQTHGTLP